MQTESPAPVIAEPSAPAAPQTPANRVPPVVSAALLIYALYGITSGLQQLLELPSYTGPMFGCAITLLVLISALAMVRPAKGKVDTGLSPNSGRKLLWAAVGFLGLSIIVQAAAAMTASLAAPSVAPAPHTFAPVDFGKHKKNKKNGEKKSEKESGETASASGDEKGSKKKRDTSND